MMQQILFVFGRKINGDVAVEPHPDQRAGHQRGLFAFGQQNSRENSTRGGMERPLTTGIPEDGGTIIFSPLPVR